MSATAYNHPIVHREEHRLAVAARRLMDMLLDTKVGSQSLAHNVRDWWVARVLLTYPSDPTTGEPRWPQLVPHGGVELRPVTPADPYRPNGFDELDLRHAIQTTEIVRGHDDSKLHLGVVLALLDREGFTSSKIHLLRDRCYTKIVDQSIAALNSIAPDRAALNRYVETLVRYNLFWFPYGLDRITHERPVSPPAVDATYPTVTDATYTAMLEAFQNPSGFGDRIIRSDFMSPQTMKRFIAGTLDAVSTTHPPFYRLWARHLNPRLHLTLGVIQAALYEWFHRCLRDPVTYSYEAIDEFTSAPPPVPGAGANSEERFAFIAYHSLVYLAFNAASRPVTPSDDWAWNKWVRNTRDDPSRPQSVSISKWLLLATRFDARGGSLTISASQMGHLRRFALGLDQYLRIDPWNDRADTKEPSARSWSTS